MSSFSTPPSRKGKISTDTPGSILLNELFNAENVTVERLGLELQHFYASRESVPYALVLHNILSKVECNAIIARSESQQFETAQINVGDGKQELFTEIRNNDRTFLDDDTLAEGIWNRIINALPKESEPQLHTIMRNDGLTTWNAVGLNERLRVLRYDPGTYFKAHYDGSYQRNDISHPQYGDTSFVTAQIYLNEGFQGGATAFLDPNSHDEATKINVIPKAGSILLFEHQLLHEGSLLEMGRKYTIRTDIMYHKT